MKTIKELLIDPFTSGYGADKFLGVLSWMGAILIFWLCLWAFDSSFLPVSEREGVINDKSITLAHTITTYIKSGDVLIPHTTHYPTTYNISIDIEGISDWVSISEQSYNSFKLNEVIMCKYSKGRIWNTIYISELINNR